MGYTLSPHVFLVPIARAGLCSPSHDHRYGGMGGDRDVSVASPAVLIMLHQWRQGGGWSMCCVSGVGALPPPIALWPRRTLFLPFVSPEFHQLSCESLSFLQGWTPIFLDQPAVILEKWCQLSLYIPLQKQRGWGQSTLESRKSCFQGPSKSLKEKISHFSQAVISKLVMETITPFKFAFGSHSFAIRSSSVKCPFAVKECKSSVIHLDTWGCFVPLISCSDFYLCGIKPLFVYLLRKKMFRAVQLLWFLFFKPNLIDA